MNILTQEQAIDAIRKNPSAYKGLLEELRKNPDVLRIAIENWPGNVDSNDVSPLGWALPDALTIPNMFLAIDKGILSCAFWRLPKVLTNVIVSDIELLKHYMVKCSVDIYETLPEELRKDPGLLRIAIENWPSCMGTSDVAPLGWALPDALTISNMFLAIDKGILTYANPEWLPKKITEVIFSNIDLLNHYMEKCSADIYKILPEELRKNPEILRTAIINWEHWEIYYETPLKYAFPEALTNELIDWLISNNMSAETDNSLNNELQMICEPGIFRLLSRGVSDELKKDPRIQKLKRIFDPKFLKIVGASSIHQYLTDYGIKYNIIGYGIKNVIMDDMFIKRVLVDYPQVYTLLSDEEQKDKENIRAILDGDGTNLIYVPFDYATADLINVSKQSYSNLFETLEDSTKFLVFIDVIEHYEKIFAYALYIFTKDLSLLNKFVCNLKNNEHAYNEMCKLIQKFPQLFHNFLEKISFNQEIKEFFAELMMKNNISLPKKINYASNLYGPIDTSFKKAYKFIRCVVGINSDGQIEETDLGYNMGHHNVATIEIGLRNGCKIETESLSPFILGLEVARQGTLIIQIEGSSMNVYLPGSISLEQYNSLKKILESCKKFEKIRFVDSAHPNVFHEDDEKLGIKITLGTLENYCANIVKYENELSKSNTQ